jgi:hypothetical protein
MRVAANRKCRTIFGGNLPHGILTKFEKRFIGVYGKFYLWPLVNQALL